MVNDYTLQKILKLVYLSQMLLEYQSIHAYFKRINYNNLKQVLKVNNMHKSPTYKENYEILDHLSELIRKEIERTDYYLGTM